MTTPTNAADPLAQLRDIHLPEAIGWWPPSLGWWLLLALLVILIVAGIYWLRWREIQRNKPIVFSTQDMMQAALLELAAIERLHAERQAENDTPDNDSMRQTVADISQLLRRCAVQIANLKHTSTDVAGLTGDAWVNWLDSQWSRNDFSQGAGRILMDAPYRKGWPGGGNVVDLLSLSRAWMEQQR